VEQKSSPGDGEGDRLESIEPAERCGDFPKMSGIIAADRKMKRGGKPSGVVNSIGEGVVKVDIMTKKLTRCNQQRYGGHSKAA